jgi:glutaredoxin
MSWKSWLRLWWPGTGDRSLNHWCVVLYTRQGCHLCDTAWELLKDTQQRHHFSLEKADIDGDPALVAEHGLHVPVVSVNGKVRFRGVVNAVLLRRLFDGGE